MNEIKFKIGDYKFTFKYCEDEAFTGEKTRIDGYRAFVVGGNKNGVNCKILFILSKTSYSSKSEIIQNKYYNLEDCFYRIGIKYLEERISENNLISEEVNIMNYL